MYNFATYYKNLKIYFNSQKSDEAWVNELFSMIINVCNIKNKKKETLYLDRQRVSKILNNKDNIPKKIEIAIKNDFYSNSINEEFIEFIDENINYDKINILNNKLLKILEEDKRVRDDIAKKIINCKNDTDKLFNLYRLSLILPNKVESEFRKCIWENGENGIYVIAGDLLNIGTRNNSNYKKIIVIPVNTTFDINVTRTTENTKEQCVSPCTLHGKFLDMILKDIEKEELNERICNSLLKQNFIIENNKKIYPIGTTISLDLQNSSYFLVAISNFDKNNKANSCKENIEIAIKELIKYYDDYGEGYNLYIPLLGTGRSRAQMSLQESLDLIIKTLLENKKYITGNAMIVIQNKSWKKIRVKKELINVQN